MTRSYLILLVFDIAILTWYFHYVRGIIICNVHKFGQFGLYLYAPVSYSPFKRQSYKMIKHSQTSLSHELEFSKKFIADELFECVWSFYGIGNLRFKSKCLPNVHWIIILGTWKTCSSNPVKLEKHVSFYQRSMM